MFIAILGILDIIIGCALGASTFVDFAGNGWILLFGIIALIKGIYSVAAAAGGGFYFDVLGWLDLAAGIFLLMAHWDIAMHFFLYIGILLILKGIYSFFVGFVSGEE